MSGHDTPPSVEELRGAWAALRAGRFRTPATRQVIPGPTDPGPGVAAWVPEPGEQVLPVVGCHGSVGATMLAVALALTAGCRARVVECCSVTTSGLAAASDTELGLHQESGWLRGTRDGVVLERAATALLGPDEAPVPTAAPGTALTVLDVGSDVRRLLAGPSWVAGAVGTAATVVAVTTATVPGLRRLEDVVEQVGGERTIAAIVGPPYRKWPRSLIPSAGRSTRLLLEQQRFVVIPRSPALAVAGLDSAPLPVPLIAAAGQLVTRTHVTIPGGTR